MKNYENLECFVGSYKYNLYKHTFNLTIYENIAKYINVIACTVNSDILYRLYLYPYFKKTSDRISSQMSKI